MASSAFPSPTLGPILICLFVMVATGGQLLGMRTLADQSSFSTPLGSTLSTTHSPPTPNSTLQLSVNLVKETLARAQRPLEAINYRVGNISYRMCLYCRIYVYNLRYWSF